MLCNWITDFDRNKIVLGLFILSRCSQSASTQNPFVVCETIDPLKQLLYAKWTKPQRSSKCFQWTSKTIYLTKWSSLLFVTARARVKKLIIMLKPHLLQCEKGLDTQINRRYKSLLQSSTHANVIIWIKKMYYNMFWASSLLLFKKKKENKHHTEHSMGYAMFFLNEIAYSSQVNHQYETDWLCQFKNYF